MLVLLLAVLLIVAGIVLCVRRSYLFGAILIVLGLIVWPAGHLVYDDDDPSGRAYAAEVETVERAPTPAAVVSGCRDVSDPGGLVLMKCSYIAPGYQFRAVIQCVTNGAYANFYGNWTRSSSSVSCPSGWRFFRIVGVQYRRIA